MNNYNTKEYVMNTNIRAKNINLSDSMKLYLTEEIKRLDRDTFTIHHFDVLVNDNMKKGISKFEVEFLIKVDYQKELIVLKSVDKDFYNCVSLLVEKTEKRFRRLHERKINKRSDYKSIVYNIASFLYIHSMILILI